MTIMSSVTVETFDSHIVSLLDKLDHVRGELRHCPVRAPMHVEVRRLEFWRAVLCECLGSFFLVFLVCSTSLPWSPLDTWAPQRLYAASVTAGMALAVLTQCFWRCSGAHMNPAISIASAFIGRISPLRCLIYVAAQCGGSVAGSAVLYGSSTTSLHGTLGVSLVTPPLTAWQGFGNEFVLTFVLALVFFSVTEPNRRPLGNSSVIIGLTYMATSLAGAHSTGGSMNPARSLGPAFVMDIWKDHWVYWLAPVFSAILAALLHGRMFNGNRHQGNTHSEDLDSVAGRSERQCLDDEVDTQCVYSTGAAPYTANYYGTLRSQRHLPLQQCTTEHGAVIYSGQMEKCRGGDSKSIYGGTKSMYAGAAPANGISRAAVASSGVTRSQSMYMKDRYGDWFDRFSANNQLTSDKRTLSSYVCMSSPVQDAVPASSDGRRQHPATVESGVTLAKRQLPALPANNPAERREHPRTSSETNRHHPAISESYPVNRRPLPSPASHLNGGRMFASSVGNGAFVSTLPQPVLSSGQQNHLPSTSTASYGYFSGRGYGRVSGGAERLLVSPTVSSIPLMSPDSSCSASQC